MHQAMHKHSMANGPQSYMCYSDPSVGSGEWPHSVPHPSNENPGNQLSVVTTVWGVTTTTHSGPLAPNSFGSANTTVAPAAFSTGQQPYPRTMSQKSYQASLASRQNGPTYNGYATNQSSMNMGGPVPNSASDYHSPHSALGAAALVAAAATATATATASVVALQEKQQSGAVNNSHYGQIPPTQVSPYQPSFPAVSGPQRLPANHSLTNAVNGMNSSLGSPMNSITGQMTGHLNKSMANIQGLSGSAQSPHPNIFSCSSPGLVSQNRARMNHYSSPQQHLAQKRPSHYSFVQYGSSMQQCATGSHTFNPSQYPGSQPNQFPKQQYSGMVQQPPVNSPNYLSQQAMRPSLRPQSSPYANQSVPYYSHPQSQMNGATQQGPPYDLHYATQFPQQNMQRSLGYQSSPVPGNPTPPPLTPASGIPYLSPNPDLKPTFPEMKPLPGQNDELRLTFPVRDGVILAPFRLEHNLAVSNHVFHLKPTVHQTLTWRTDLELQLKCFHHEDRQMNTNWPSSVQVSVNATPLCIDRGENKTSHKPLYLKDVCQPGRNTIQITVAACCCSHLFLLQLVHRPTVRSVLQGLLRKRLLPAEHCIQKIKRNFTSVAASTNSAINGEDGVEQTAIKVSLKCPITFKRITLPARGQECKHIQAFDLESYLQLNSERGAWRCPVCNKPALLEGLEVDQYIWGILTNLSNSDVEEVTIDATASWKPIPLRTVKEEHDGDICGASKRFKATSPSSMTMPTTSTWEMGQGLSPYSAVPPPDIQAMPNGAVTSTGSSYNGSSGGFDFHSQASDFSSPLSHLNESVSSLDPLAAMEKTLIHHEQQMGPPNLHEQSSTSVRHAPATTPSTTVSSQPATPSSQSQALMHGPQTPHTPHTPHTPGNGPPSVPASSQQTSSENNCIGSQNGHVSSMTDHSTLSHAPDLSDLNFDPAAVIEGEGQGQEGLNLLPETVDPMELLSYLDPPDLGSTSSGVAISTTGSSLTTSNGVTTSSSNGASDDLLALFEN